MKRALFGLLLGVAALAAPPACSTKVPLAQLNDLCEYDEQCDNGLACRCVRRRNPDDEGPDEILSPGVCQTSAYRCAGDAGVTDTAPTDSAATDTAAALDTAADATDTATTDATDGG